MEINFRLTDAMERALVCHRWALSIARFDNRMETQCKYDDLLTKNKTDIQAAKNTRSRGFVVWMPDIYQ